MSDFSYDSHKQVEKKKWLHIVLLVLIIILALIIVGINVLFV